MRSFKFDKTLLSILILLAIGGSIGLWILANSMNGGSVQYITDHIRLYPTRVDCHRDTQNLRTTTMFDLPILWKGLKVRLKSDVPDNPEDCIKVKVDDLNYDRTTNVGWIPYLLLEKD